MQALLFEVEPRPGHEDHYFRRAAALRPLLAGHDGLLFLDRYRSESRPGIILSHSRWRDEAALARWRADGQHHAAQCAGRAEHFKDYRIRISHVLRAIGGTGEDARYSEDGAYADPDTNAARYLAILATRGTAATADGETFRSVTAGDTLLTVVQLAAPEDGHALLDDTRSVGTHAMLCRVTRDYGMFDRAEAPQHFPDAAAGSTADTALTLSYP